MRFQKPLSQTVSFYNNVRPHGSLFFNAPGSFESKFTKNRRNTGQKENSSTGCSRCNVSILSHGFLDAMTSGGLGVGFFIPYSSERFFFPLRPIRVSPIKNFLTARGLVVLQSELLSVWFPLLSIAVSIFLIRTRRIDARTKD